MATAYLAADDVPKRNCDCHVSVTLCASGNIANDFCPVEDQKTVSLLNFRRTYPSNEAGQTLTIGDQIHCAPYELTETQIAEGLLKPGADTYMVCTEHTEPVDDPWFDPDNPDESGSNYWPFPGSPDDPDNPYNDPYWSEFWPDFGTDDEEVPPATEPSTPQGGGILDNWFNGIFNP